MIYDPEPTRTVDRAWRGINVHAAEGLYAVDSNPVMDLMAEEGIRWAARCPRSVPNRRTWKRAARRCMAPGCAASCWATSAWRCTNSHTLGGSFNLPHAQTHTIVLPHALAYNAAWRRRRPCSASRALCRDAARRRRCSTWPGTTVRQVALRDIGMQGADLDRACDIALQNQYPNPRPLERAAIRQLLQDAFEGKRPSG